MYWVKTFARPQMLRGKQGTFLLHKFVDIKNQQKCASTKMWKRPPALDELFLQTSVGHFSVEAHFC